MLILGIETSCDETAVSLVDAQGGFSKPHFKILSNVISSQIKLHKKYGGVVPNLAAREHAKNLPFVVREATKPIPRWQKRIDCIAVTVGPGLIPALLVGVNFARALAYLLAKPILGVNHLEGHIYSNWLRRTKKGGYQTSKPLFPAVCLIVSGGHTEVLLMKNYGIYQLLGETRDDAVGEAFDKVARILSLGYPGGPAIDHLAREGDPAAFPFPRPMRDAKNYDFSFSGLKTAVLYGAGALSRKERRMRKADLAASFQAAAIETLVAKTIRASQVCGARTIMVSGGVAANSALRNAFKTTIPVLFPVHELTTDNAAMIAMAGYFNWLRGTHTAWGNIRANANLTISR